MKALKMNFYRGYECCRDICMYKSRKTGGAFLEKEMMNLNVDPKLIRNTGMIAHIDAGKTTVTERLLYLAGVTKFMGNVDSGNTVTDYLELERERGITVQSAAVSLFWRKHRINLIDTPGHVDFTIEVERCLRVLDGAIIILDASAGVQAQTVTVWRQAKKFCIPSIFFINKMDRQTANFRKSVDSISERLGLQQAIAICVPSINENGRFTGVLDALNKRYLNCDLGDEAQWLDLVEDCSQFEQMMRVREELLSKLADADDDFAEMLLRTNSDDDILNVKALDVLRRLTLSNKVVPLACGSALRCVQSVSPILDLIVSCLPFPTEKNNFINELFVDNLCALVFKIAHDKKLGQLTYVRVYSGEIKSVGSLYNASKDIVENKYSVYIPNSDQLQVTPSVKAGNIAVLIGLKSAVTGDTLVASKQMAQMAEKKLHRLSEENRSHSQNLSTLSKPVLLAGIETPDPVYFCTVEAPSEGSSVEFEKAIRELAVEDPSLHVKIDSESGQTVIGAMGELHIEVVKDKLQRNYGLNVFVGPLQVAYREVIESEVINTSTVVVTVGDSGIRHECKITCKVMPKPNGGKFKQVVVLLDSDNEYSSTGIHENWLNAVNEGCANALHSGPLAGFTVYDLVVVVTDFVISGGRVNPAVISATASKCIVEALRKAGVHIIEPIMNIEVIATSKMHTDFAMQEIFKRRSVVTDFGMECNGDTNVIKCSMPLDEMQGFSKSIRIVTSGHASIHAELGGYRAVSKQKQKEIINSVKVGHR